MDMLENACGVAVDAAVPDVASFGVSHWWCLPSRIQSQSGSRSTFSVSGGVFTFGAVSGWIPRAPLSSCTPFTDRDFVVSTPLYLAVTCSMLVLPEEYLSRFFWEMASRYFRIQLRLVRQSSEAFWKFPAFLRESGLHS